MRVRRSVRTGLAALLVLAALAWGCEQSTGTRLRGQDDEAGDESLEEVPEQPLPEAETPPPKIAGIEIIEYPDITFFARNQPFSHEGLVLRFIMDNGEYGEYVAADGYTVSPIDTSKAKAVMVNVTVSVPSEDAVHDEAYTADFVSYNARYGVEVDNSTLILTNVELVKPPSKTAYKLGEKFSLSGLVIRGKYYDSDSGGYGDLIEFEDVSATVSGYDRRKRGTQQVKIKFNGTVITTMDVSVRIPPEAVVTVNGPANRTDNPQSVNCKPTYIRGMAYDFAKANLKASVALNNETFPFSLGNGLNSADVTGFKPNAAGGKQTLTVRLDDASTTFEVYLADVEPHVYFDYGFRRHSDDPLGVMPGGGYTDSARTVGRLAAAVNEKLVLAPVRFLIGWNDDNTPAAGTVYQWSVSGPSSYTASYAGEFLYFCPKAAGDYDITVNVTGRSFVDGATITRSATMRVACYQGTQPKPAGNTYTDPLKHFGCGQFGESGTGTGWSLGSALGYEVWNGGTSEIVGNQFEAWNEPGIVWTQGDGNGNGVPDETWREITGSDDRESSPYKSLVSRRYAISYFNGSERRVINDYGQTIRDVYWVDSKGRTGRIPGGFPVPTGVPDYVNSWVIYTGTILRDDGEIATGSYKGLGNYFGEGYVDAGPRNYSGGWPAIYADGSSNGLPPASAVPLAGSSLLSVFDGGDASPSVSSVDLHGLSGPLFSSSYRNFVKVQTAIFHYGGVFGDVSTEIQYATGLPDQSNGFPDP